MARCSRRGANHPVKELAMGEDERKIYGVQFHPEFKSYPISPHPLFREFIGAALKRSRAR